MAKRPTNAQIRKFATENADMIMDQAKANMFGLDNEGFCVFCGEGSCGGCEPDAAYYKCETCGTNSVFGAEELVLYIC